MRDREIVIIQPPHLERVLSGVCYKATWLYCVAREKGVLASLYEEAGIYDADDIFHRHGRSARYVVDISSYPQIDTALQIAREFREYKIEFIGLDPLITELGLPLFDWRAEGMDLTQGAFAYLRYVEDMRVRLHSDYDAHVARLGRGRPWMPAFFSVGCDRRCPYCYVGYHDFPSGTMPLPDAKRVVDFASERKWDLHFFDEDFFRNPQAEELLAYMTGKDVNWICLTTSVELGRVIRERGQQFVLDSGNVLNEVGVETADPDVLEKKQDLRAIVESEVLPFWLTVTFFPKETVASKNATGAFLRAHGYGYDDMVPRMRCNSTEGGLGQFFVSYHGTPWRARLETMGEVLSDRPTRLWPGFVPFSFLGSKVRQIGKFESTDKRWFDLYGTPERAEQLWSLCREGRTVDDVWTSEGRNLEDIVLIAQLAQLGLVR